jgi:predicted nucleotide-binding protein
MEYFSDSLESLQALIVSKGLSGKWSDLHNGHSFRANDGAILIWYPNTGRIQYQGPAKQKEALKSILGDDINLRNIVSKPIPASIASSTPPPISNQAQQPSNEIFVVHGHDINSKEQLERILLILGHKPKALINSSGGGQTIIEALESEIGQGGKCKFGIVLLTPDDLGYAKGQEVNVQPRARQNVVLEMGMLIAAIGRQNTVILKKGILEVPSDAQGIIYLQFENHVKEVVPKLAERLRISGFEISAEALGTAAS